MNAWIEITSQDGGTEFYSLTETQATLGRSVRAGIALVNQEELLPEHLLLAPRHRGCWIAVAQGASLVPLYEGKPFPRGLVPWGSTLNLGSIALRFSDRATSRPSSQKRTVSPVMLVALVTVPLSAWLLLSDPAESRTLALRGTPPDLFGEAPPCPVSSVQALAWAREAAESASRTSERYPFDPRDGIEAVRRWQVAESCYLVASHQDDAERVARLREQTKRRILEDYSTRQLGLERALEHRRYREAANQAHLLNAMVSHLGETEYTISLVQLERQLLIRVEREVKDRQ